MHNHHRSRAMLYGLYEVRRISLPEPGLIGAAKHMLTTSVRRVLAKTTLHGLSKSSEPSFVFSSLYQSLNTNKL